MKSIQKIAEEIFQAPTEDELFERTAPNGTKINAIGMIDEHHALTANEFAELKRMFPRGVFYHGWHATHFEQLENYIQKYAKNKRLWKTSRNRGAYDWYVMEVKNRTVLQITSRPGEGISAYYIEDTQSST